jgi:hypothetical protein
VGPVDAEGFIAGAAMAKPAREKLPQAVGEALQMI